MEVGNKGIFTLLFLFGSIGKKIVMGIGIALDFPSVLFGGPSRTFLTIIVFGVLQQVLLGKGFLGRGVLAVNVHQFGTDPASRDIQYGKLVVDLVFSNDKFVHRIYFPGGFYRLFVYFDMPLFTSDGSLVPGLKITGAP